ncbi:uncharacterized protein LOC143365720 [Halictus rubicundus]|uniref:uncharacterized protein LOC143365720 n=1 Tax=Halictus rubicundus TaxID=77578 RepID=UPI0040362EC5
MNLGALSLELVSFGRGITVSRCFRRSRGLGSPLSSGRAAASSPSPSPSAALPAQRQRVSWCSRWSPSCWSYGSRAAVVGVYKDPRRCRKKRRPPGSGPREIEIETGSIGSVGIKIGIRSGSSGIVGTGTETEIIGTEKKKGIVSRKIRGTGSTKPVVVHQVVSSREVHDTRCWWCRWRGRRKRRKRWIVVGGGGGGTRVSSASSARSRRCCCRCCRCHASWPTASVPSRPPSRSRSPRLADRWLSTRTPRSSLIVRTHGKRIGPVVAGEHEHEKEKEKKVVVVVACSRGTSKGPADPGRSDSCHLAIGSGISTSGADIIHEPSREEDRLDRPREEQPDGPVIVADGSAASFPVDRSLHGEPVEQVEPAVEQQIVPTIRRDFRRRVRNRVALSGSAARPSNRGTFLSSSTARVRREIISRSDLLGGVGVGEIVAETRTSSSRSRSRTGTGTGTGSKGIERKQQQQTHGAEIGLELLWQRCGTPCDRTTTSSSSRHAIAAAHHGHASPASSDQLGIGIGNGNGIVLVSTGCDCDSDVAIVTGGRAARREEQWRSSVLDLRRGSATTGTIITGTTTSNRHGGR